MMTSDISIVFKCGVHTEETVSAKPSDSMYNIKVVCFVCSSSIFFLNFFEKTFFSVSASCSQLGPLDIQEQELPKICVLSSVEKKSRMR
jgi:hypothetical protein